ncbi:glycosyltransferase [Phenylobacterium sp. LjRoot219]|uniref:glycosyltransferase family 2 protein n=1 Tax=Phenylobacterium sp. LjRoot219 TaxID=3342283 RepID=UPI003ECC484F
MPRVTVAIPAYKPAHLGQAIASVLGQTFADFELLISDDCPDDAVRAVVAQFRDPRIRLIEGPRQGLVANSVHLWEQAGADLLKYVYDDDFLLPFGLADLVDLLGRDPGLTFAFCARHIVDADGRILHSNSPLRSGEITVLPGATLTDALVGGIINPIGEPTNLLIRRSSFGDAACLRQYGGAPVRHHIDVAFFMNAAERGPCVGTPAFGAAFRRHANQVTSLRQAADFSYGVAEWELFVRGAVSRGVIAPQAALRGFDRLELHYRNHLAAFPELAPLAAELPRLRQQLQAGARELLDADFRRRLSDVEAAIAARKAAGSPPIQA